MGTIGIGRPIEPDSSLEQTTEIQKIQNYKEYRRYKKYRGFRLSDNNGTRKFLDSLPHSTPGTVPPWGLLAVGNEFKLNSILLQ